MLRKIKRVKDLGILGTFKRIDARCRRKIFALRWKKRALARKTTLGAPSISPVTRFIEQLLVHPDFETFFREPCQESAEKIPTFPQKFYQEIEPSREHDIKIPWEHARFQRLFAWGRAYEQEQTPAVAEKFQQDIVEWIDKNPFLIGVNWVCPMEVAIRAINWIFAYHFFKDAPTISQNFWKKFLSVLYEHMFYLEHNWETSDRPNNHYITDLIGYFYLTTFFGFEKKRNKIIKEILKEFFHQVRADGTAYEGSSAYHRLDTELFLLFSLACEVEGVALPKAFHDRQRKMLTFLEDCATSDTHFLQIGDNDSGKIVCGLRNFFVAREGVSHYPDFGITIVRKNDFHISFRHPTYKKFQPTGHFHRDELAVTLAYKGVPILVDPGSFAYTADEMWRNAMRAPAAHNTFYKQELFAPRELFQLDKFEQDDTAEISENFITNHFMHATRRLIVDKATVCIEDLVPEEKGYKWSFLFHPLVRVEPLGGKEWGIFYEQERLLIFESNVELLKEAGFYSPSYGTVQECVRLTYTPHKLKSAAMLFNRPRCQDESFSVVSKIKIP